MNSQQFLNAGLAFSMVPGLIGLNTLVRPESALRMVKFPIPAETEARRLATALMRIYAIRNVAVSGLLGLVWSTGQPRLLGHAYLPLMAMCITDGFVSRWLTGGGEWSHWSFAPIMAGLMAGLYGWVDL